MADTGTRLISNIRQALANHAAYQAAMKSASGPARDTLIDVIPYIQSWIVVRDSDTGAFLFAPSKFVGYVEMDAERYHRFNRVMDGRLTELALKHWIEPISENDPEYEEGREALFDFCARFGAKPNGRFRMSRLLHEAGTKAPIPDREALIADLLVEVFRTLPANRQQDVARRCARAARG